MNQQTGADPKIPKELVEAIDEGRCIVFVGAGVTAPVMGTWRELLFDVAERLDAGSADGEVKKGLAEWLHPDKEPRFISADDYEAAAEYLRKVVSKRNEKDKLESWVQKALKDPSRARVDEAKSKVEQRIQDILQIPFKAVFTSNFDDFLPGKASELNRNVYARALATKPSHAKWFVPQLVQGKKSWTEVSAEHRNIVKLHGDVASDVVLSSSDYSRRLYLDPAYLTFMRSMMATHTFLYLGFSFTDAYINAVRREIATVFGMGRRKSENFDAYAVMPEVSKARKAHFEEHEGVKIIDYKLAQGSDDPHAGFDHILSELVVSASPIRRLRRRLAGKRIVWIDENVRGNQLGLQMLGLGGKEKYGEGGAEIVLCNSGENARAKLEGRECDLVITYWGHAGEAASAAERFLRSPDRDALSAPVIVFCAPDDYFEDKRARALRAGAFDLTKEWWELFDAVDRVFLERRRNGDQAGAAE